MIEAFDPLWLLHLSAATRLGHFKVKAVKRSRRDHGAARGRMAAARGRTAAARRGGRRSDKEAPER